MFCCHCCRWGWCNNNNKKRTVSYVPASVALSIPLEMVSVITLEITSWARMIGQRVLGILDPHHESCKNARLYLEFLCGCWLLNSGPHDHKANILPVEPFPQALTTFIIDILLQFYFKTQAMVIIILTKL